jgi:hypothetical protein
LLRRRPRNCRTGLRSDGKPNLQRLSVRLCLWVGYAFGCSWPHRRCRTAGSDLGELWPSRLVARRHKAAAACARQAEDKAHQDTFPPAGSWIVGQDLAAPPGCAPALGLCTSSSKPLPYTTRPIERPHVAPPHDKPTPGQSSALVRFRLVLALKP